MSAGRLLRGGVRLDRPVLGMSVQGEVKHAAVVARVSLKKTKKTFVRFSGSIPTVTEGAIETPIQSCGDIVSGATAVTGLVVVEALRMFNPL